MQAVEALENERKAIIYAIALAQTEVRSLTFVLVHLLYKMLELPPQRTFR